MSERVQILIGLGSNVEPERHLPRALLELSGSLDVAAVSNVYASDPVGAPGSPRFLNAAVLGTIDRSPEALKAGVLRPIEAALGRSRAADRNAPRTIDLDLLLYGQLVVDDPRLDLRLPDPELLRQAHVAIPAAEAWPDGVHPVTGESLAAIAARLAVGARLVRVPEIAGWLRFARSGLPSLL